MLDIEALMLLLNTLINEEGGRDEYSYKTAF